MQHEPNQKTRRAKAMTLADVLELISASDTLAATRKRDMRSAIAKLCSWLGHDAEQIPATRRPIADRIRILSADRLGISTARLDNVRSLINAALDIAGAPTLRRNLPIAPVWADIVKLATRESEYNALSKFGRFATQYGYLPHAIDDRISGAYLSSLSHGSMVSNPREKHQDFCRIWNRVGARNPEASLPILNVPRYRNGYGLPRGAFPPSFRADCEQYASYLGGDDIFAEKSVGKALRPSSIQYRIKQLYSAAALLVGSGVPIEAIVDIAFLVRPENVEAILRYHHKERSGSELTKMLSDLAQGLYKAALRYVEAEPAVLDQLRQFKKRVQVRSFGMTDKNRQALRHFNDPAMVARLKLFPLAELDAVDSALAEWRMKGGNSVSCKLAVRYQKALAVLILQYAPMRARNLAELHLTRHLNWTISPGRLLIQIEGYEVKNDEPLVFELPEQVTDRVRRYVDIYRRAQLRGDNDFLFPGEQGKAKSENNLSQQIAQLAMEKLGVRLTAHQWRHVMGKVFLDSHPGQYEVLRRVLAHRSIETTMSYYAGEETTAAVRHYQRTIEAAGSQNGANSATGNRKRGTRR